mmetsp:Transcript_16974/g.64670  ORF Transcript_16974/g.64670 Transcript_16974/m.64670 type:complete len:295 (-) Transcript_16974:19-903(-)
MDTSSPPAPGTWVSWAWGSIRRSPYALHSSDTVTSTTRRSQALRRGRPTVLRRQARGPCTAGASGSRVRLATATLMTASARLASRAWSTAAAALWKSMLSRPGRTTAARFLRMGGSLFGVTEPPDSSEREQIRLRWGPRFRSFRKTNASIHRFRSSSKQRRTRLRLRYPRLSRASPSRAETTHARRWQRTRPVAQTCTVGDGLSEGKESSRRHPRRLRLDASSLKQAQALGTLCAAHFASAMRTVAAITLQPSLAPKSAALAYLGLPGTLVRRLLIVTSCFAKLGPPIWTPTTW